MLRITQGYVPTSIQGKAGCAVVCGVQVVGVGQREHNVAGGTGGGAAGASARAGATRAQQAAAKVVEPEHGLQGRAQCGRWCL